MKKISVILFLAIFTPLLLLQVSCSTIKEEPAEGVAAEAPEAVKDLEVVKTSGAAKVSDAVKTSEAEKTPVAVEGAITALFLADTHKSAGVACSECHKETPPASEVPTEMCMTCHEDYREVAASAIDPHNAHVEFTRCGDCHHGHRKSENQCLSCHSFSLEAP
jgi:Cytochrome c3